MSTFRIANIEKFIQALRGDLGLMAPEWNALLLREFGYQLRVLEKRKFCLNLANVLESVMESEA